MISLRADDVVAQGKGRSSDDEITLFFSVGLAGTEIVLADELIVAALALGKKVLQKAGWGNEP